LRSLLEVLFIALNLEVVLLSVLFQSDSRSWCSLHSINMALRTLSLS